jgi:hypothetical protein
VRGEWTVKGDVSRIVRLPWCGGMNSEVAKIDRAQLAAPTAQEIADQLEDFQLLEGHAHSDGPRIYRAMNVLTPHIETDALTMAEALAALWLRINEGSG